MRFFFTKYIKNIIYYILTLALTFHATSAYAIFDDVKYEDIADNHYDSDANRCDMGSIEFNPFSNNEAIDWELGDKNPVCVAFVTGSGAAILAADFAAGRFCTPTSPTGLTTLPAEEIAENAPPPTPFLSVATLRRMAVKTGRCTGRIANSSLCVANCANPLTAAVFCPQVPFAAADVTRCCAATAAYYATIASSVAALATIYAFAKTTYEKARLCGHDWTTWKKFNSTGEVVSNESSSGKWKKTIGPYQQCIKNAFVTHTNLCDGFDSTTAITNKNFREYVYGGKEFIDSGSNGCKNPDLWDADKVRQKLGYTGDTEHQRYYMTGSVSAPVYACHRFLTSTDNEAEADSVQVAYDCCKARSQSAMCIENKVMGLSYESSFCSIGERCTVSGVTFDIYESKRNVNYVCAKTYSVCPYNHLLGGGTETKKMDETDPTQVVNFCQFLNHCSKIPILPHVRVSNLEGAFFSSACKDLKGDSQNVFGYTSDLLPINNRGFSAPMVQCFKETMENIFLNRAGDTKCRDPEEKAHKHDFCTSGYFWRKGDILSGNSYFAATQSDFSSDSFFVKIQKNLKTIIKVALIVSVTFFGVVILLGGGDIKKKQLLPYILKIGLVMYFAVGTGWQSGFMQGLVGTSTYMADFMFRADESKPTNKLDGCQFPRFNYSDDSPTTKYTNARYPEGKSYLRVWDTLDCKIAMALGFGPEVSVPNLAMMIVGGLFTGGAGVVFFVGTFLFAFFLIALTIRAVHIMLISITAVIILIYVSPIVITLAMFNRTKPIFEKWWKQLLGLSLQPMILFAYLGILITLFDTLIIGDVTFTGDGKENPKQISCTGAAEDESMYCIFRVKDIKTYNGLELLGIGIPMLASINSTKINSILKAAIIMFIFTKFMDQISGFAAELVGGKTISSGSMSAMDMAGKAFGTLRGIQKRGVGAISKGIPNVARAAGSAAKGAIRKLAGQGKSVTTAADRGKSSAGSSSDSSASRTGKSSSSDAGKTASSKGAGDSHANKSK